MERSKWFNPIMYTVCTLMMGFLLFGLAICQIESAKADMQVVEKVVITRPAIPKIIYHGIYNSLETINNEVTTLTRDGYVNIRVSGSDLDGGAIDWFLIAEKY